MAEPSAPLLEELTKVIERMLPMRAEVGAIGFNSRPMHWLTER